MRGQLSIHDRQEQLITRLKSNLGKWKERIKTLQEQLKTKDQLIEDLRRQLADKEQQRKQLLSYLYKPSKTNTNESKERKPREQAYRRPNPADNQVTEEHAYPLCACPLCKKALGNVAETVTKYEEDIDLAPRKIIKKYIIHRYWCPNCQTFVRSTQVPDIQRIGPNVMGYVLYARYRLRLPYNLIQNSLLDLHDFKISEGEINQKLQEAKDLFGKDHDAICELIKNARAVHADETGWRMNGANWWLWVFVTDKGVVRYVIEDTRGQGVPKLALGGKTDRVIISDGYAAYAKLPGQKQQCWVHLLRNAKFVSQSLYEDLLKIYLQLTDELTKPINQRKPAKEFEDYLAQIIARKYSEPEAKKIQNRAQNHSPFLFTCLGYDNVLTENNTAERAIRKQVIMRKVFGGSRSLKGTQAHQVNTSVIETQLKQNPDKTFFQVILPLLKQRRSEL